MKIKRSGMLQWYPEAERIFYPSCPGLSRHPRLTMPTIGKGWPGKNPAMTKMRILLRRALGGLGKFLQHAVALQLRQIIHEQHAVEMIDLMLDAGGEQILGVFLMPLAVEIGEARAHLRRSLHFLVIFRDRQATFLINRHFL